MNSEFLMIPNKIILDKELLMRYDYKAPYILSYLMCTTNKFEKCYFSLEDLITTSGNKLRTGANRTNEQFKSVIKNFIEFNLLKIDVSIDKVNLTTLLKGQLFIPYDINNQGQRISWFSLDVNNYLKIINSKNKLNKTNLINLYFYILARIIKRNDGINNITITGGSAEVFWENQENMSKDLNISKQTLNTYLKYLKELNLIFYGNIGKVKKDKYIMEAPNVYSINNNELKYGLEQSKYYWKNQGWKLIENKIKN